MLTCQCQAKSFGPGSKSFWRMLETIDQVVRILAFKTLVEREGLQAGEADEVGVLDFLGGDTVVAQQLSLNLGDLVQIKNTRRVRDVQRRDRAIGRQRLHPTARDIWRVGQQLQHHQGAVLGTGLPAPR